VPSDYDAVVKALDAGLLAGRPVREVPTGWDIAYAVDISPDEVRVAWQQARALVKRLGRWPIVTTSWGPAAVGEADFSRFYFGEGDNAPQAVCSRARELSREDALRWPSPLDAESYFAREWRAVVQSDLDATLRRVGATPALDQVLALDLSPDHVALERWLLEWEEARRPTTEPEDAGHLGWFEPDDMSACALLLLPTPASEEVPAYLSFFGAEGPGGHERLIAILRSWRGRFGAEMVASWGTMLQLDVTRPPQQLGEAFELAVEQYAVAPSTLDLAGVSIRDHARTLMHRTQWFLHARP